MKSDAKPKGRFKECWAHEIDDLAILRVLGSGYARLSIGFFDAWAKKRAAELGLRLIATDDFEVMRCDFNAKTVMRATVLLEDVGDAPIIEGEAVEMHNMGLVPYIRQIERRTDVEDIEPET